ncbi:4-alpha-glucanotransferase, partial [bacterium]|nr:4-alpha-glucanotransferase [bacterium]
MKLNNIGQNSFQRAFTTHERKRVENLQLQARKELGIEETSAIIFGFNVPSMAGFNYGIGTLNSKSAIELINFLKTISQISRIQASPEGELKYEKQDNCVIYDTSPYSSGSFTLGSHTISLEKLATKEYGGLLSENYLRNLDIKYPYSKEEREYKTDYGYTFGKNRDGVVFESLKIAYENFKNQENSPLRAEFENFKKTMNNEIKQSIDFDAEELNEQREFLEFCQFIARKQHFETKKELNSKGIKYFGDCLICFSPREVKAHPECFKKDKFIGTEDPNCPETKNIQAWWANSPDYDKLGEFDENGNIVELGEFGQLLYEKFKNFMELYDGIRLDAFWQYVTPFEYDKDLNGGYSENLHDKVLKILEKASIDAKGYFSPEDFVLELVGYGTNEAKALTKNIYPHIYSTAYAQYNENPRDLMENVGYQDGKFTIGMANHDNDTIVNMSRNTELREIQKPILKRALNRGYEFLG